MQSGSLLSEQLTSYMRLLLVDFLSCFFFFQAEDGIRDLTVTGVQTCALPICLRDPYRPALEALHFPAEPPPPVRGERVLPPDLPLRVALGRARVPGAARRPPAARRSAERGLLPLHRPLLRRPLPDRVDPRGQLLGRLLPCPPARGSRRHRAGARLPLLRLDREEGRRLTPPPPLPGGFWRCGTLIRAC